jgi:NAD(P)-dependent dehydrogenase (short-subunit alcohol dehydrogenase family)
LSWSPGILPDQTGRTFVVTGGNAGLGYFTAEQLASTGAHVVLASRDQQRMDAAARSLRAFVPGASISSLRVDLASLDSAREAGRRIADLPSVDGLILNAGATTGPRRRSTTDDGNEWVLATNFLGHFALAALAWPALKRTPGSRLVGLGSIAPRLVRLDQNDLQSVLRYDFFRAYGLSKHATQGFVLELDRRVRAAGIDVTATLAHPGYAVDGLTPFRPGVSEPTPLTRAVTALWVLGKQGKNRGAAATVRAALDPTVVGGEFVGPEHLTSGRPVLQQAVLAASSASPEFGAALWARAEAWTGTTFDV